MRLAIIDLGTNTFNLLVAEKNGSGRLRIIHEEERPVFLGRGGIGAGLIAEDAFGRGMETLRVYTTIARAHGAQRIAGFGTSMLRNARNGKELVQQARAELDIDITIIPGDEEAGLILDGVRQATTLSSKPTLVMDIGGGSIEFILATDKALMWKQSFEIGVTRLLERFRPGDPLTLEEQLRIGAHLDARLEPLWAVMDRHWPATLVGSAGSFDTLASIIAHDRKEELAPEALTLTFPVMEFDAIKDRLLAMPRSARLDVPGMSMHRVDTIGLALIAIERVLLHGISQLCWSRYALKEGAAFRLLR